MSIITAPKRRLFAFATLLLAVLALAACGTAAGTPTAGPTSGPTSSATLGATAVPTPAGTPTVSYGAPNWVKLGFATVLTTQNITPGTAATIKTGPYTVQIPADAFLKPVKFEVLSGDPAHFQAGAPNGQTAILAFAFQAIDPQNNQLVNRFNKDITLTVNDPRITAQSIYYNIGPDGTYGPVPAGMQVSAGQMTHTEGGASSGKVITSPK